MWNLKNMLTAISKIMIRFKFSILNALWPQILMLKLKL